MVDIGIMQEVNYFLSSFLTGVGGAFLYDLIRTRRRRKKRSVFAVCVTDVLYWTASAIGVFLLCYYKNNGQMRMFALEGYAGGMLFYLLTLSRTVLSVLWRMQSFVGRIAKGLLNFLNIFQIFYRKK
jgi:spore cortex biosynthesis protein YabQ